MGMNYGLNVSCRSENYRQVLTMEIKVLRNKNQALFASESVGAESAHAPCEMSVNSMTRFLFTQICSHQVEYKDKFC